MKLIDYEVAIVKDGTLNFGDDFVVCKNFTTSDLKKIEKKYSIESVVVNSIYSSYKTKPISFLRKEIIPTLYFENGTIVRVSIYFSGDGSGWSTNTEAEEKKLAQDAWLKKLLNKPPPYDFNWGEIESIYDPRSCSSSVVVSFKRSMGSDFKSP